MIDFDPIESWPDQIIGMNHVLSSPRYFCDAYPFACLFISSRMESTSLIFAYGHDIFSGFKAPSKSFDVLDPAFNKLSLLLTCIVLGVATVFVRRWVRIDEFIGIYFYFTSIFSLLKKLLQLHGNKSAIKNLNFHPFSIMLDSLLYSLQTLSISIKSEFDSSSPVMAVSPNGKTLAVATSKNLVLVDSESLLTQTFPISLSSPVFSVSWSKDSLFLILANSRNNLILVSMENKTFTALSLPQTGLNPLAYLQPDLLGLGWLVQEPKNTDDLLFYTVNRHSASLFFLSIHSSKPSISVIGQLELDDYFDFVTVRIVH